MRATGVWAGLLLSFPVAVRALGPHEVLVLANESSPRSIVVAKEFARLRGVPPQNLVRLRVPLPPTNAPASISPDDFTQLIWTPAVRAVREQGLGDHILAWVYSLDFPIFVTTPQPISIEGLTFLRNRLPNPTEVRMGTYASPLFTGPNNPNSMGYYSETFDELSEWLGGDMPLPSMRLGYAGERGNSEAEVLACLERGARADGSAPSGTVYFVTNQDVRSTTRAWEYPLVVKTLTAIGVRAEVTDRFPTSARDVVGLMTGAAVVRPDAIGGFRPGAMAEHFTSGAGVFHTGDQTKLTAWIAAGATASAGTVAEPYAIWTKFPHARFFVHYAAGCTLIESFYQSVRCPLQLLMVGDPLAQPWGTRDRLTLQGLGTAPVTGRLSVKAVMAPGAKGHYSKFVFLLDGKVVGRTRTLELDTGGLAEGAHALRAVAYRTGMVRGQTYAEQTFAVGPRP